MASKKNIEIRALSTEELQQELAASDNQFQKLKFNHAVTGVDNPNTIVEARRDIARIKTELRSREVSQMTEAQLAKRSKTRSRRSNRK